MQRLNFSISNTVLLDRGLLQEIEKYAGKNTEIQKLKAWFTFST